MKICITSEGNTLDSKVDGRFGRCQYFIIVDTQTLEFEAIQNPNIEAMGGAGIQYSFNQRIGDKRYTEIYIHNDYSCIADRDIA